LQVRILRIGTRGSPLALAQAHRVGGRLMGESMGRTIGQQIIVENGGGAGGTIGMARVAKAAPDGYTVAIWHIAHATAPALYDNLKYDPVNDFDHLGRITDVPMTLVSKTAVAAKDVKELIDWIRAENGKVTYRNRWVRTKSFLEEEAAGRALWEGVMEPPRRDRPDMPLKDTSNTDVVFHGGRFVTMGYLAGGLAEERGSAGGGHLRGQGLNVSSAGVMPMDAWASPLAAMWVRQ